MRSALASVVILALAPLATLALATVMLLAVATSARAEPAAPAPTSFDRAREQLRVQIRGLDDPIAPGAVWRSDLLDTRTVLVRVPEPGHPPVDVTVEEAAPWARTPEELFRVGLENLEQREPPRYRQTPELDEGVRVGLLYGEHPFAASYALAVEHYPRCMGNHGSLVATPTRYATLCFPIESDAAGRGHLALAIMASRLQVEGHEPVVPHVYWFREGDFEAQRVRIDEGRVDATRTEAFKRLLKELPPERVGKPSNGLRRRRPGHPPSRP